MNKFVYFKFPNSIDRVIEKLKTKDADYWEEKGEENILKFSNFVIVRVPAYKEYLMNNNKFVNSIKDIKEFKSLPLTSKRDYFKKYPYSELFPKSGVNEITTISSTSGSTGDPFYFPRGEEQDRQYEYVAEIFLKNQFELGKKRTLAINGFGLGIWIGGIFTYKNLNKIASKGYHLAVAPVGTNKNIFLKTFSKMSGLFEQIILMGYPPFIKDIADVGKDYGINWKKYDIKILTATEGYTEKFREHLIEKFGIKNRYKDIINIYGSVELGTMSHETPIANLIRKIAVDNRRVFKELFPKASEIPTLAQYYPYLVYFEDVDGEVVASGYGSSFPILRYRFFDSGGVIPFNIMIQKLGKVGVDIYKEANKVGIGDSIFRLPFVYVYGRSDFVIILRGANIYPENIKSALLSESIERFITGKFCMIRKEDKKIEEYLEINIELKNKIRKSLHIKKKIEKVILSTLREKNSEFNYLFNNEGKKLTPRVVLYPYEHPKYFGTGIKQTWLKK